MVQRGQLLRAQRLAEFLSQLFIGQHVLQLIHRENATKVLGAQHVLNL
jgi:hypothetical protein